MRKKVSQIPRVRRPTVYILWGGQVLLSAAHRVCCLLGDKQFGDPWLQFVNVIWFVSKFLPERQPELELSKVSSERVPVAVGNGGWTPGCGLILTCRCTWSPKK